MARQYELRLHSMLILPKDKRRQYISDAVTAPLTTPQYQLHADGPLSRFGRWVSQLVA